MNWISIGISFALLLVLIATIINSVYAFFSGGTSLWGLSWAAYCRAPVLFTLFLILMWLAIVGQFKLAQDLNTRLVSGEIIAPAGKERLFVLIHGLKCSTESWKSIIPALKKDGDILPIDYPIKFSNAEPLEVAKQISSRIQQHSSRYDQIVLIGHSVGALMVRQTFLDAANNPSSNTWVNKTKRIVLIAGTNRGWDLSGKKPADMRWFNYIVGWVGSSLGRLAGVGQLLLATEIGAPFVANLRLEWMRWFQEHKDSTLEVIQLLGDIDDYVSDEDNKDLRVNAGDNFVWLRVRGTGHANILYVNADDREPDRALAEYRGSKILAAVKEPLDTLRVLNEELPYGQDDEVTHLVFIIHGIRDLGEWSAKFEKELRNSSNSAQDKIAIASIRYGYFGMGPFLLGPDRQKYVRWFMDEYTETLAKYPNVKTIDLIGHSNGTYLMASALAHYDSLRVDKVVFAGSVVPQDFDWERIKNRIKKNGLVRNYVAADDWVVALFPRLFELPILNLLGNDIGSAGFNGFRATQPGFVQNVQFLLGHHSAFLDPNRIKEIATFIMNPSDPDANDPKGRHATREGWLALKFASDWLSWMVWLLIAAPLIWIGFSVAGSGTQPTSLAVLLYALLVIFLLRSL